MVSFPFFSLSLLLTDHVNIIAKLWLILHFLLSLIFCIAIIDPLIHNDLWILFIMARGTRSFIKKHDKKYPARWQQDQKLMGRNKDRMTSLRGFPKKPWRQLLAIVRWPYDRPWGLFAYSYTMAYFFLFGSWSTHAHAHARAHTHSSIITWLSTCSLLEPTDTAYGTWTGVSQKFFVWEAEEVGCEIFLLGG